MQPGGYTSNGPFNFIRITRDGTSFDIDGFSAPRREPTGFIHPGDHVYIDGRNNYYNGASPATYGYTTASVGDNFRC